MTPAPIPNCIKSPAVIQEEATATRTATRYVIHADELMWVKPIKLDPEQTGYLYLHYGELDHPKLGPVIFYAWEGAKNIIEFDVAQINPNLHRVQKVATAVSPVTDPLVSYERIGHIKILENFTTHSPYTSHKNGDIVDAAYELNGGGEPEAEDQFQVRSNPMDERVFVKPGEGRRVRWPEPPHAVIAEAGEYVRLNTFFKRRLRDGDLVKASPPAPAPEPASEERITEMMKAWFYANYENPANTKSPDGPYDAREEISRKFSEFPKHLITKIVDAVEAEGVRQWALMPRDDGDSANERTPDIPDQTPHFAFAVNDAGQIDLATDSGLPTDEDRNTRELRQQLAEALDELIEKLTGSNAHPEISKYATRYREAVLAAPLSIDILYAKGLWFENAIRRVKQDIAAGEAPTLTADIGATLDMSLSLHGLIIASTARGQELMRLAEEYAATNFDNQAYQAAAQPLIEAVGQSTNLFTAKTINFVSQANSEIEEGEHPKRSSHVGRVPLANLLVTIGKIVLGETKKIIASGVRQGLTTLVATSVFAGVTAVSHETLRFFLDNISVFHALSVAARDTFLWLGHLLHWITPLL